MKSERRTAPRIATSYAAWLVASEKTLIPCTVANVSPQGAQLCIGADMVMPKYFDLWYAANRSAKRACRVAWRQSDRVGVQFADRDEL